MAAYGLYTHIQSNKRRSIALLVGLFFLVYLLVYAGALLGEAFTIDAPPDELLRRALHDALYAAPWATLGTALWILIAYKFHQSMIDAVIESVLGHELTHIRNGDVRMLVIAVIIAGVIAFFAELVFRLMFQGGFRWRSRGSGDRKGAGLAMLIALALIAVAWILSIVI